MDYITWIGYARNKLKPLFYLTSIASFAFICLGLYFGFRPEPNLNELKTIDMRVSSVLEDSVWIKQKKGAGRWKKDIEVRFSESPVYLAYTNSGFDVYYETFLANIRKLPQDSSLTIWYSGEMKPSTKYPGKMVIEGSQVEKIISKQARIYSFEELESARRDEAKVSYIGAIVFLVASVSIYRFSFRRIREAGTWWERWL